MTQHARAPMTRRQFHRLGAIGGLALVACDAQANPGSAAAPPATSGVPAVGQPALVPSAERVRITQWFDLGGAQAQHVTRMGELFGQAQNGINVETRIVPQPELATTLITALAAGDPPEIVHAGSTSLNAMLIDGNHTEALDQWDPKISSYDWVPAVKQSLSRKGKLMAYPANTGVLGLIYNKDLYEQQGLDPEKPPGTMDDLATYATRIAKPDQALWGHYVGLGPNTWAAETIFVGYLWAFGGDVVSADGKQVIFNSAEGQAALQYYVDLAQRQVFPLKVIDAQIMGQDFEAGNVGSITLYPIWVSRMEKTRHRSGTATFPQDKAQKAPVGATVSSILQQAKQKRFAWPYIQWLMQPENHLTWVTGFGNLPSRLSYREHPAWKQFEAEHPLVRPYAQSQVHAESQYHGPAADFVWGSLAQALEAAVHGRKSVKQALDDAAREAQEMVRQALLSHTVLTWFR